MVTQKNLMAAREEPKKVGTGQACILAPAIHHDLKADLTFLRKAARRSGVVWFIS